MKLAVVELHDVSPFYERETYAAVQLLKELEIDKFSILLIPNFNGKYSLENYKEFVSFLKELNQENILHGLTHKGKIKLTNLFYTYGEGEFGDLGEEETAERIKEALSIVKTKFFVPPAWIGNPWLEKVLSDFGFIGVAYREVIKVLRNEREIPSPVLTFSNRVILSYLSIKTIPLLFNLTKKSSVIRLVLHTKDFRDRRKISLWKQILSAVKKQRRLVSYEELLS